MDTILGHGYEYTDFLDEDPLLDIDSLAPSSPKKETEVISTFLEEGEIPSEPWHKLVEEEEERERETNKKNIPPISTPPKKRAISSTPKDQPILKSTVVSAPRKPSRRPGSLSLVPRSTRERLSSQDLNVLFGLAKRRLRARFFTIKPTHRVWVNPDTTLELRDIVDGFSLKHPNLPLERIATDALWIDLMCSSNWREAGLEGSKNYHPFDLIKYMCQKCRR